MSNFEPIPLPENYKSRFDLEAMLPGDTAFIYAHSLKQEANNGGLYLNTETELSDDLINPTYFPANKTSDRVGIIRIYQDIGGESISGFIVDITDVKPGIIKREKLFPVPDDKGNFDEAFLNSQQHKWSQVLSLRYKDAEGVIKYIGPDWLYDSAEYLGEVFEGKRAKEKSVPRESSMPGIELMKVQEPDTPNVVKELPVKSSTETSTVKDIE